MLVEPGRRRRWVVSDVADPTADRADKNVDSARIVPAHEPAAHFAGAEAQQPPAGRQQHWDVSWGDKRRRQLSRKSPPSGKSPAAPALGWAQHVIRVARRYQPKGAQRTQKTQFPYLTFFSPPIAGS